MAGNRLKHIWILLALAALVSCKPEYKIPRGELPELPEGAVLWLDLMRWNGASIKDTTEMKRMWDALHLSATLQGIVNREAPVLYLDYVSADGFNTDEYWWDKYSAPGEWLAGKERVTIYDPVKACDMLRDRIEGMVVYDPKIPATSCIASMVAGVENVVAVRYDPSPGSIYNRLKEREYPVKVWLVEQDGSSKFKSKTDAYRWAIDQYLKPGKCNTEYAGYYIDQCWLKNPGASTKNHHLLSNHDYFVSKRAFFFDLSPWSDEVATDDPAGEVGADYRTLTEILLECYRQNGNGETFCHIGGFPAWAYKYTDHKEVGGKHTPVQTEWKFAEIIGEYNAFKDADAIAYGAIANSSFWQHFPLRPSYPQAKASRKAMQDKGYLDANGHVDLSKRYVLLYVGDYDAASWVYQTTPSIWDDPQRGKVPMMWSISPILARRAPQALHYLWTSASENDWFAAADNGAGYLNPGSLEEPRLISGLPDGMAQWARHCKPWYEQWGITVTGFIIDGNAKGMTQAGFKAYASFSPDGIVPQKTPVYLSSVDGMPVLRAGGSAGASMTADAAEIIRNTVKQHTECPFYWFRAVLKTPSWYVNVKSLLDQSNPEIVWMSGPEYFELLKCYLEEQ
jgi:hypothetical protein